MKRSRAVAASGSFAFVRIALLVAVWLALFTYAGRPLLVAAHATGLAPAAAWSLLAALSVLPLLPFFARGGEHLRKTVAIHWIGYATMAVFSILLFLVAAGDVVRLAAAMLRWVLAWAPVPPVDVVTMSFATLGAAALLSAVGALQARCPAVRNVTIELDELPDDLDGYRIVQWSDVHISPSIRERFIEQLVERTNELEADAIAITGDLIDGEFNELRHAAQPMANLRAKDGVFYVTGNHEYYWRASEWLPELQRLGLMFLENEHRLVRRGNATLAFAGVTDPVARGRHQQDVPGAVTGIPAGATTVLLSHRPQMAEEASRLGVAVQLSGHTHGGQFFPFNLFIKWFQPIVAGLHRVGRTWLYVSRGTGYWGPPSRLFVGSEITVITLTRRG